MASTRTGDRHINQSISVRLGTPLQSVLEEYLSQFGIPKDSPLMQTAMRSFIKDSVQYRMDVIRAATSPDQSDDE